MKGNIQQIDQILLTINRIDLLIWATAVLILLAMLLWDRLR